MIESRFYCKDCHTGFNTKQNYEYHINTNKHKIRLSSSINNDNLHICSKCQKKFAYASGLSRHRITCKYKSVQPQILAELDILQKDKMILEEKNAELCKEIEQLKNNQQNITNNNNIKININCFGNENMDYINDKTILQCISKVYGSIPMIIERIHFDSEHPENNNVKIPNKKLPHAQVMTDNKWKLVDRSDTIHSMIDNGYNILDETFQEKGHVLSNNQQKHFKTFQTKYEDGDKDTIKDIKERVELLVINNSRT